MKRFVISFIAAVFLFGAAACQQMRESPIQEAERLLQWSTDTLEGFARQRERWDFGEQIRNSRALLIFPAMN